jgi:hypothetical protein
VYSVLYSVRILSRARPMFSIGKIILHWQIDIGENFVFRWQHGTAGTKDSDTVLKIEAPRPRLPLVRKTILTDSFLAYWTLFSQACHVGRTGQVWWLGNSLRKYFAAKGALHAERGGRGGIPTDLRWTLVIEFGSGTASLCYGILFVEKLLLDFQFVFYSPFGGLNVCSRSWK